MIPATVRTLSSAWPPTSSGASRSSNTLRPRNPDRHRGHDAVCRTNTVLLGARRLDESSAEFRLVLDASDQPVPPDSRARAHLAHVAADSPKFERNLIRGL